MSKSILSIQVREEEKALARTHLAEALKVSPATIRRWTEKGTIPRPSGVNGKYTQWDISDIFSKLRHVPHPRLRGNVKKEWNLCVTASLVIYEDGLFVNATSGNSNQTFEKMIARYGIWDAQGLNNHEHIRDYVKNPVLQLCLAKELIESWIARARALPEQDGHVIIYWNEKVDSTLCIYFMRALDEVLLEQLDRHLGIERLVIKEVKECPAQPGEGGKVEGEAFAPET